VQQKTARLREIAAEVAFVNGYQFTQELSAINQRRSGGLRQIFAAEYAAGRDAMYLSTDFENAAGAFEVFDFRGHHLGEWLFSGARNKDADSSGRHDISLKR
jgi:hypothetical protein